MKKNESKVWPFLRKEFLLFIFLGLVIFWFAPFFFAGKLPIPSDNLLLLAHPFRDRVWDGFIAGVPAKNTLIADPYLQTYPWKKLAIDQIKAGRLPLWNPYTFAGTPLLANFQSSVFSPLNLLLFLPSFAHGWSLLIFSQPLIAGALLYFYLRNLGIAKNVSLFGAVTWSFSGIFVSWLEWGTYLTSLIWLPLSLLATDKFLENLNKKWAFLLFLSIALTIFGGHIQIAFYSLFLVFTYIIFRSFEKRSSKLFLVLACCFVLGVMFSSIQSLPTLEMIGLSSRDVDQPFLRPDWFYPWQQLISFLAPDFFGNPVRLNYWGVFNYIEFNGYFGLLPLFFAVSAILFAKKKSQVLFFSVVAAGSLVFALNNPISRLPFVWHIPFFNSAQPSRLVALFVFSMVVLASFGLEKFLKSKTNKKFILISLVFWIAFGFIWFFTIFQTSHFPLSTDVADPVLVARRNLVLPTLGLFLFSLILVLRNKISQRIVFWSVFIFVTVDLLRLAMSFEPFTKSAWLYPQTNITKFLEESGRLSRVVTTDRRIFPPNVSIAYGVETMDGYDPLYLSNYATVISAWQQHSGNPSVGSFNRMVRFQNYESSGADLYGARYILSFDELSSPKLKLLESEGKTLLYENTLAAKKAYLVRNTRNVTSSSESLSRLIESDGKIAVTENAPREFNEKVNIDETLDITKYIPGEVEMKTNLRSDAFLVLADNYYPGWQVYIDSKKDKLIKTNFSQMGVFVPPGKSMVRFEYDPDSFKIGAAITLITFFSFFPIIFLIWQNRQKLV